MKRLLRKNRNRSLNNPSNRKAVNNSGGTNFNNYFVKTYTAGYETEQADVANEHLPVLYCRFVEMNIKHRAVRFMVCGFQASVLC